MINKNKFLNDNPENFFKRLLENIKLIYQSKALSRAFILLAFGLFSVFITPKFDSTDDFYEIKANFYNGRYYYYHLRNRKIENYIISLYGYSNRFVINDTEFNCFDRSNFEFFIKTQDVVFVNIAKKDIENLNSSDIPVYGISGYRSCYLDYRKTIKDPNDKTTVYVGIVLILISLIIFYIYRDEFKPRYISL